MQGRHSATPHPPCFKCNWEVADGGFANDCSCFWQKIVKLVLTKIATATKEMFLCLGMRLNLQVYAQTTWVVRRKWLKQLQWCKMDLNGVIILLLRSFESDQLPFYSTLSSPTVACCDGPRRAAVKSSPAEWQPLVTPRPSFLTYYSHFHIFLFSLLLFMKVLFLCAQCVYAVRSGWAVCVCVLIGPGERRVYVCWSAWESASPSNSLSHISLSSFPCIQSSDYFHIIK